MCEKLKKMNVRNRMERNNTFPKLLQFFFSWPSFNKISFLYERELKWNDRLMTRPENKILYIWAVAEPRVHSHILICPLYFASYVLILFLFCFFFIIFCTSHSTLSIECGNKCFHSMAWWVVKSAECERIPLFYF